MYVIMRLFATSRVKIHLRSIYIDRYAGCGAGASRFSATCFRSSKTTARNAIARLRWLRCRCALMTRLRPWAKAIRDQVRSRKMPPWPADPCCGHFSNDRSLSAAGDRNPCKMGRYGRAKRAICGTLLRKESGRRAGISPRTISNSAWRSRFEVPASGAVEYQYFPIPTGFKEDRWVQAVEVRPGDRPVVHHIVVYIREPGSTWTGGPTKADILTVYAPGSTPDSWPEGMAKLIKAGSDLVLEIHYTPKGQVGFRPDFDCPGFREKAARKTRPDPAIE